MFLAGMLQLSGCPGSSRDVQKAQTRSDLAKDLLAKGQLSAAETEIKKAVAYDPENEEQYLVWGLIDLRRAQDTLYIVERADCLGGADEEALRGEADAHMRSAEQHFAKATTLAPDYGEAWQNRSAVALHFQDWDKAKEYAEKALAQLARLNSEVAARINLGRAYLKKGDAVHAITTLLQATQGQSYVCLGNYWLAQVYFSRTELEDALERLRPILDDPSYCKPAIQEAQYLGGEVLLRLHDKQTASKAFNQCIEMAPKSCQARECERALQALAAP
jgi:tetratricopeptide (TPR) repeat protein